MKIQYISLLSLSFSPFYPFLPPSHPSKFFSFKSFCQIPFPTPQPTFALVHVNESISLSHFKNPVNPSFSPSGFYNHRHSLKASSSPHNQQPLLSWVLRPFLYQNQHTHTKQFNNNCSRLLTSSICFHRICQASRKQKIRAVHVNKYRSKGLEENHHKKR